MPRATSSHPQIQNRLSPMDVLLGRGNGVSQHAGNAIFRELVDEHRPEYAECTKTGKRDISLRIVRLIQQQGGNFVERYVNKSHAYSYHVVSLCAALAKTSQALRERKISSSRHARIQDALKQSSLTSIDSSSWTPVKPEKASQPRSTTSRSVTRTKRSTSPTTPSPPPLVTPRHNRVTRANTQARDKRIQQSIAGAHPRKRGKVLLPPRDDGSETSSDSETCNPATLRDNKFPRQAVPTSTPSPLPPMPKTKLVQVVVPTPQRPSNYNAKDSKTPSTGSFYATLAHVTPMIEPSKDNSNSFRMLPLMSPMKQANEVPQTKSDSTLAHQSPASSSPSSVGECDTDEAWSPPHANQSNRNCSPAPLRMFASVLAKSAPSDKASDSVKEASSVVVQDNCEESANPNDKALVPTTCLLVATDKLLPSSFQCLGRKVAVKKKLPQDSPNTKLKTMSQTSWNLSVSPIQKKKNDPQSTVKTTHPPVCPTVKQPTSTPQKAKATPETNLTPRRVSDVSVQRHIDPCSSQLFLRPTGMSIQQIPWEPQEYQQWGRTYLPTPASSPMVEPWDAITLFGNDTFGNL